MKKLFEAANRYIGTSDWKIIAVLKFCLISLGLMIGMAIGKKYRKPVFFGALGVFAVTYVPLMVRFYKVFTGKE
jgi:predicted histidine transporter YuiF (NhaC family)